jgi:hypothetical protein
MKREGQIYTWSLLQYGFVVVGQEVFFLHSLEIIQGADKTVIGAKVIFDVAPPLPGKRYQRAVNAIVGGIN